MIDRLSRKRERGAIRRKARARVPEKLKVFWEKEQAPEEAKPQERRKLRSELRRDV